ncbi:hypothetical protein C0995_011248 [Termitomyces sp. Mi166|nr:hypothetical protein C0995_011248 [Termitomyces sp. Mi166\
MPGILSSKAFVDTLLSAEFHPQDQSMRPSDQTQFHEIMRKCTCHVQGTRWFVELERFSKPVVSWKGSITFFLVNTSLDRSIYDQGSGLQGQNHVLRFQPHDSSAHEPLCPVGATPHSRPTPTYALVNSNAALVNVLGASRMLV